MTEPADPEAILAAHEAGNIDRPTMLRRLARIAYTFGEGDPVTPWADGYIPGTWRVIERALIAGRLTDDEYETLRREAHVRRSIAERRDSLNLAGRFEAAGESWTEADADGNPVTMNASEGADTD